jgi:2-oxoisovalerate dehydrogenase E1 component
MFMLGVMSIQQMFAQLYAHADLEAEPNTGGRGMNAHFTSTSSNSTLRNLPPRLALTG